MRQFIGWILFLVGALMLVVPQALTGLAQLKWLHEFSFPAQVLVGIPILGLSLYLVKLKSPQKAKNTH